MLRRSLSKLRLLAVRLLLAVFAGSGILLGGCAEYSEERGVEVTPNDRLTEVASYVDVV